ncbi:unnamed protein product [Amoebophrya sp. A25]|nr:unnamed protein product [Amoebophrya sp. A25]|eukprot:GSA25T00010197001.1
MGIGQGSSSSNSNMMPGSSMGTSSTTMNLNSSIFTPMAASSSAASPASSVGSCVDVMEVDLKGAIKDAKESEHHLARISASKTPSSSPIAASPSGRGASQHLAGRGRLPVGRGGARGPQQGGFMMGHQQQQPARPNYQLLSSNADSSQHHNKSSRGRTSSFASRTFSKAGQNPDAKEFVPGGGDYYHYSTEHYSHLGSYHDCSGASGAGGNHGVTSVTSAPPPPLPVVPIRSEDLCRYWSRVNVNPVGSHNGSNSVIHITAGCRAGNQCRHRHSEPPIDHQQTYRDICDNPESFVQNRLNEVLQEYGVQNDGTNVQVTVYGLDGTQRYSSHAH